MSQKRTFQDRALAKDPPSVEILIRHMSDALRRAYADGFKQGELAAMDRVMVAVGGKANPSPQPAPPKPLQEYHHPASRESRTSGNYGRVVNHIRSAVYNSNDIGVSREAIFSYCANIGVELTPNQYKDTIKRLAGGEEIVRRHNVYFIGPRFRRDILEAALADGPDLLMEGFVSPAATHEQPA